METIIEESIWDIEQKLPLRKVILKLDGNKITRNLFILNDSERRNNKVDVIDLNKVELKINLSKINELSIIEIGELLKEQAKDFDPNTCFERNLNGEIPFFINPIITKK